MIIFSQLMNEFKYSTSFIDIINLLYFYFLTIYTVIIFRDLEISRKTTKNFPYNHTLFTNRNSNNLFN